MQNKLKIIILFLMFFFVSFNVQAQDIPLTNKDILEFTSRGVDKDIIIQMIRRSKSNFDLSGSSIIALTEAKVAKEVMLVMIEVTPKSNVTTTSTSSSATSTLPLSTSPSQPSTGSLTSTTPQPPTGGSTTTSSANSDVSDCSSLRFNRQDTMNNNPRLFYICTLVNKIIAVNPAEIIPDNADTELVYLVVSESIKRSKLSANEAAKTFFLEADKKRTDKQIGSTPNSSGTTSLAVKGGAPSVIGWAVENGAATSSISGTTVTIRINPFGLTRALQREGFLGSAFADSLRGSTNRDVKYNNFLRRFSTGFSFDTTRGQETPTFIVSKQQLSAVSARFEFINERTPWSNRGRKLFNEFVPNNADIFRETYDLIQNLKNNTGTIQNKALNTWTTESNKEFQKIQRPTIPATTVEGAQAHIKYENALKAKLEERLKILPVDEILEDTTVKLAFQRFIELTLNYVENRKKFAKEVNKGTVATFEYTNNREPIAPDTSNFRFIVENGRLLSTNRINTDFTFNASLTTYNKKPSFAGVKRIRDFQFALQTDTLLGDVFGEKLGDPILTFAGRYERLNGDTINPLGVVTPNSKGDIIVGQVKLTIPIAEYGIRLPLSLTFANRSEFIKESNVRANFGFTFDLDPLFAKGNPFGNLFK